VNNLLHALTCIINFVYTHIWISCCRSINNTWMKIKKIKHEVCKYEVISDRFSSIFQCFFQPIEWLFSHRNSMSTGQLNKNVFISDLLQTSIHLHNKGKICHKSQKFNSIFSLSDFVCYFVDKMENNCNICCIRKICDIFNSCYELILYPFEINLCLLFWSGVWNFFGKMGKDITFHWNRSVIKLGEIHLWRLLFRERGSKMKMWFKNPIFGELHKWMTSQ